LIALDSRIEGQPDIYTVDVRTGVHKQVTFRPEADVTPRFSRDGSWIYFSSRRLPGEIRTIWKIPVEGGEGRETRITDGRHPWESPDGRYLYFLRPSREIWRRELSSGEEEKLLDREMPGGYEGYEPVGEGVFYDIFDANRRKRELRYFDLVSREVSARGLISDRGAVDWGDITPDGKKMFFAQIDREGSDLVLVENFH
jgi:hypothetical protein